jgi:hypothetical protein
MSSPRITYTPRPDATPEAELSALANVYKLVLDNHARKKGSRPAAPDDPERSSDARAESSIP